MIWELEKKEFTTTGFPHPKVKKFSSAVKMMVNRIKDLGPAPLKDQLNAEG